MSATCHKWRLTLQRGRCLLQRQMGQLLLVEGQPPCRAARVNTTQVRAGPMHVSAGCLTSAASVSAARQFLESFALQWVLSTGWSTPQGMPMVHPPVTWRTAKASCNRGNVPICGNWWNCCLPQLTLQSNQHKRWLPLRPPGSVCVCGHHSLHWLSSCKPLVVRVLKGERPRHGKSPTS
jgi:hypothetical protein